jgi:hypothetical protein
MIKKVLLTILFYLISIASIYFLYKGFPSGPCRIGIDDFSLFAFLFTIVFLFFINLYRFIKTDKTNLVLIFIHLFAIISIIIYEITL